MTPRRSPLLLLTGVLATLMAPDASAQGQPEQCNILENQRIERRVEAGVPMIYVTGPFLIRCPGGEELRAQQGNVNELTREILLTGSVFFQDPTRTLTANQATYWASLGRLYATGNVVFSDREEGSTIRGPELDYYRAMEGRPEPQVNAGQRPHLTLQPRDAGPDAEPLDIDADRLTIVGNNDLSAFGNVVIRRTDLHATGGEAHYDGRAETLDLRQNARIQSEEFNLSGQTVHARMPQGVLERVHALVDATLVGEELRVDAPELQLFFADELLQRAVARTQLAADGGRSGRAIATARAFRLEGDSIDALTPAQRVDRVTAIGSARGESIDTVAGEVPSPRPPPVAGDTPGRALALIDRDWIVGDTIIGYFDYPAVPVDEAAQQQVGPVEPAEPEAELRRIVALGMAQSLYRVEQDGAQEGDRRGINYLAGERIELTFEEGELQVAEVSGLRRGIYLDPEPAGSAPAEQTAAVRPAARRGGLR
jgi:lipopolysaccharide export system protein LptA